MGTVGGTVFGLFALPLIDLLHAFLSSECSEFS